MELDESAKVGKEKKEQTHELAKLKKTYEEFKRKYSLPDFKFMNETFEIETLPSEDTELFLRRIRKNMTEKIAAGLRAMEMFLNPQPSPMFIFKLIKTFSQSDKEIISELYHKFAGFEIEAFGLENLSEEKREAEFIKNVSKEWKEIGLDMNRIFESMKINHQKESKISEKSYFG